MSRVRAVLSVLFSQKLTALWLLVAFFFGPLLFLYRPGEWSPQIGGRNIERFPEVWPFYETVDGKQVWSHFDWREVQAAAAESGDEQSLEFTAIRGFSFLPRGTAEDESVAAEQPENLHELVPALRRLSLDKAQPGLEDWRDLSQLSELRILEGFSLLPPPGRLSEGVQAVAEALSAFPALEQLNLLGTHWIRPGSMLNLEILILDAADLETVLDRENLSVQMPQLRTLILRIPPEFRLTEGQTAVLQQVAEHPRMRRVELITGQRDQRGLLNRQIDVFQSHLPGLTVCRGESGLSFSELMVIPQIATGVLLSCHFIAYWLCWLGCVPQAGTLPGFERTIRGLFAMFAVAAVLSGFLSAWLLELRWYTPVCLSLLAVSFPGAQPAVLLFLGGRNIAISGPLTTLPVAFFVIGLVGFPRTFVPLAFGDIAVFNNGLLLFATGMFVFALAALKKGYAWQLERGESAVPAGVWGSGNRQRAVEQLQAGVFGTCVPSPRLLGGNFSDRLRAASSWRITGQQLRTVLIMLPVAFLTLLTARRELIFGGIGVLLAGLYGLVIQLRVQTWNQRTKRLGSEFLLPVGRDDFWRHFRKAILRDFAILPFLLFAGLTVMNYFRDSFSNHLPGTCLQFGLQVGQLALIYSLGVLTSATAKSRRRLFLLQIPLGLTIFVLYFDSVSQMSVPGSVTFSPLLLPLTIVPAVAGVVLLLKLPAILRQMEIP